MYSLIFRVRVTTPPQYGGNGTAHAAGASVLSLARGVFADMRSVRVRHACGGPGGLPLGSAMHFHKCCHSNATRAPIANPPNTAQLGASPTTPQVTCGSVQIVWACGCGQTHTHRQTDAPDHNTFLVVYDSREM